MPAAARRHTVAGAKAFVMYYFSVANYAQRTLDVAHISDLAARSCVACQGGVNRLTRIRANGGSVRGGHISLAGLVVRPHFVAGVQLMRVSFRYRIAAMTERYERRGKVRRYEPVSGSSYVVLRAIRRGWLVEYWDA